MIFFSLLAEQVEKIITSLNLSTPQSAEEAESVNSRRQCQEKPVQNIITVD